MDGKKGLALACGEGKLGIGLVVLQVKVIVEGGGLWRRKMGQGWVLQVDTWKRGMSNQFQCTHSARESGRCLI